MAKNVQEKKLEELSLAIDALNKGETYKGDPDIEELAQVARIVKTSGVMDQSSAKRIAATVECLAGELGAKRRKSRWLKGFSGAAGAAVAGLLLFLLNLSLFAPNEPERSYTQNSAADLSKIVQIEREGAPSPEFQSGKPAEELTDTARGKTPEPAAQVPVKAPAVVKPEAPNIAPEKNTAAKAEAQADAVVKQPGKGLLALAGRTARSTVVNDVTGEVRQVYQTDSGDEITLVQGARQAKRSEVAAVSPLPQNASVMRAAKIAAEQAPASKAAENDAVIKDTDKPQAKLNRVTVTVDGIEATIEGKMPEEELKKLAETVVKQ
ncbi:MAG: hypothetical protein N2491_06530 [Negativicutes bacterium]|nr:hypothetical protein [Negativicutes bacterium]